ncbi:MAG: hypothetical protein GEV07_22155 [Streptosporangiales bacterium]|nr:hypothetical protein [Streptosporangiales bacterium]
MSESEQPASAPESTVTVLVYSDDASIRERVKLALGRRPAADLPRVEYLETATEPACRKALDSGTVDLAIVDGEATPAGGLGICRAAKNEVFRCPPVLALIARAQDAWLAKWSQADGVVMYPLEPVSLAAAAAKLLRGRQELTTTGDAITSPG